VKIIATWSGECFTAKHVQSLARQCEKYAPLDDFVCITPETIPGVECWKPTHKWPGWWHKYEVFAPHIRGTVSMARAASPDSGDSQFFICFDDAAFLNGQYTVWGKVTEGMENVDKIKRGEPVKDPDKIVSATIKG
jgi:cyclophilin family peptidyl-prolyl cis-trans isomerase